MQEAVRQLLDALHDELDGCRTGAVSRLAWKDGEEELLQEAFCFPDPETACMSQEARHERIVVDVSTGQNWTYYQFPSCSGSRDASEPFATLSLPLTDPKKPRTELTRLLQLGECLRWCSTALVRFRDDMGKGTALRKLSTHLECTEVLDMSQFACERHLRTVYRLKAVGVHISSTMAGGHYVPYVSLVGGWHRFSDSHVSLVDWE
jgi:ubiquitin C-terminal hydrolase